MAAESVLRKAEGNRLSFWCQGCEMMHTVSVGSGDGPRWGWNGDMHRPTFTPSILVRGTERLTDDEYARVMRGETIETRPFVCHSFVTDGNIQFLTDCTHSLAGQTVPLTEIDDETHF